MLFKRDGELKSRGCTYGHTQRLWITKQDVSSPTPAFEALKCILAIIGLEARDVTSFDLPAQLLQTDMDEILHLKVTGALTLLLVEYDKNCWNKHLQGLSEPSKNNCINYARKYFSNINNLFVCNLYFSLSFPL